MRKKILFIALLSLITLGVIAQSEIQTLGVVKLSDLRLIEYEKDIDAEALILFDYGQSRLIDNNSGSFDLYYTRHFRIKIFKKSGIKFGEIEIPIYQENNNREKIEEIQAFTFNLNDNGIQKTKLDEKNQTYEEKLESGWIIRKFAMPDVKEGSIIDVKYTISSPYLFNLRDWNFQSTIPTVFSQYDVAMVPFYQYSFILQGANKFDFQESKKSSTNRRFAGIEYNDMINRYGMVDIPAFKDEEFISGIDDYILKLDFQLSKIISPYGGAVNISTTWPALIKDLSKSISFGKFIKSSSSQSKKIIAELNIADKSEEEKIKTISNYVKLNFNWNGNYGKYASNSPKQFFKEKSGNVAELNLFLVSLLRAAKIEAWPAILSTRGNGRILLDYPFYHYFNYTIAVAGSEHKVFIDATENLLPYNHLPTRCSAGKALVINTDKVEWVSLENNIPSDKIQKFELSVDIEKNQIEIKYRNESTGYDALNYRSDFADKTLIDDFKFAAEITDEEMVVTNYDNIELPLEIAFNFSKPLEKTEDKIFISPFMNFAPTTNIFTQNERKLPIDLIYIKNRHFKTSINIPENYKIGELPINQTIENELFKLFYKIEKKSENELIIDAQYNFTENIYDAKDYQKLKQMYNLMILKFNQKIILEKKNS
jgi:hypothetical protein